MRSEIIEYIKSGLGLVLLSPGTKKPFRRNWQMRKNVLTSDFDVPEGYGIGIAHAWSGTMALDIDNWDKAIELFNEQGVDIKQLYQSRDSVIINSRENRGKLLYRMPFKSILPTKKIIRNGEMIFEFRCATNNGLTVQDVLPPSIHRVF